MILITGANGQLGLSMQKMLGNRIECNDKVICTDVIGDFERLDITDSEAVSAFVNERNVNVIINCAAYTNVDKAEDEPELAEKINAQAVGNLANAAKESNALLIHISTDYVFGGNLNNTPCKEGQKENPTGVYGKTKLNGELAIRHSGCKHVIIRTAWLYSEYGHNFVKTMLNLTATKPQLNVVFDQVGTPTYAKDLATAIVAVVDDYYNRKDSEQMPQYINAGTYHFSNEGVCSWYDFTKAIASLAGHDKCDIQPCHSDEFPSKVVRPSYSVLDKTKIKATFNINIPYWADSLKECINNLTNETK